MNYLNAAALALAGGTIKDINGLDAVITLPRVADPTRTKYLIEYANQMANNADAVDLP